MEPKKTFSIGTLALMLIGGIVEGHYQLRGSQKQIPAEYNERLHRVESKTLVIENESSNQKEDIKEIKDTLKEQRKILLDIHKAVK